MCAKYDRIQDLLDRELAETDLETVMGGAISPPNSEPVTNLEPSSSLPQTGPRTSAKSKPEPKTF